jgi:diguanylate cyclase (GGDEF)-like protein/PAS domain S-box-containing protein
VAAVVVLYILDAVARVAGSGFDPAVRDGGSLFLYLSATAILIVRALRGGADGRAWAAMAAGAGLYSLASLLFVVQMGDDGTAPGYMHALWIAAYPLFFAGIVMLLRARLRPLPLTLWVDSLAGALTLGSVLLIWVLPPLVDRYHGDASRIGPFLSYPVCDAMLLTLTLAAISLTSWRPGRSWTALAAGFALLFAGDFALVYDRATSTAQLPTEVSGVFPLALIVLACAALRSPRPIRHRPDDRVVRLIFPAGCVVVALGLLVTDQFVDLPNDRVVLPLVVIALVGVRAAVTVADLRRLYESRRFERGFEDATIGMAILSSEPMRWVRVNRAFADMLGYAPEALVGQSPLDIVHPDDRDRTIARRDAAVDGQTPAAREMRFVRSGGEVVDVMATSAIVHDDSSGESYFFSQFQDISERRRAERQKAAIATLGDLALAASDVRPLTHEAVRLVAETTGAYQASLLRSMPGGEELRFDARSSGAVPDVGAIPGGTASQAGYTLLHDQPIVSNDLANETRFAVPSGTLAAGLRRGASVPVRRRGGSTHVLIVHERDGDRFFGDDTARFLEAVANVLASALDRIDAEDELRRRALEDPLTGLANRALLGSQLEYALHAAARHGGEVAVLLLDLDRFKYLNDTLGHSGGDELLREVAMRLRAEVRDEDVVARLGGDEFVVVCADRVGDAAIAEIAQRIVDVLAEPFAIAGREMFAAASVGVAVGGAGASAEGLLRDADAAMYRAKEQGGGRYEIFDAELRARLVQRVSTEAALRRALERDELTVRYQPVVEPATGRVAGFEALLRWHHPERGVVSPGDFIPIAEETDLILPIGRWVLRTACAQAALWQERRPDDPVTIAVNLSPRQVTPDLVGEVAAVLAETGLPASGLMLEITESLLLEQASTIGVVSDLRALGVRVALDDFGSGYSSLSYLQSFPLDVVKLDRGFVQALDESEASAAVVKAAIDMAGALGLEVVAEGVEREAQLVRLRDLGCPLVQGFLFAPALEPDEAAELLGGVRVVTG